MEIILAKESLLAIFVPLLHLYYLYTLYYFCVCYNACYYTYSSSPAWILNKVEGKVLFRTTQGAVIST